MTVPTSFLGGPINLITGSYANRINVSQAPSGEFVGFPAAVAGVIALRENMVYDVHGVIDIGSNRIAMQTGSALIATGFGSIRTSYGGALLTCHHDCVVHNIDFVSTNPTAILTNAVRATYDRASVKSITSCTTDGFAALGEIGNHGIVKLEDNVFRNVTRGFSLVGTIGTALAIKCAAAIPAGNAFLSGSATLVVEEAVAVSHCTLDLTGGGIGVSLDVGATIPPEGFRIIDCAFYGSGAVSGIRQDDNRSYFKSNIGLESTYPRGSYSYAGNAVATNLAAGVWTKVAGGTTLIDAERFSHTDNRLTYAGSKDRRFGLQAALSAFGSPLKDIEFAAAANGAPVGVSVAQQTDAAGSGINNIPLLAQFSIAPGDYVEIYARCADVASVTVSSGVVQIGELG